jgi:hypothetical protein
MLFIIVLLVQCQRNAKRRSSFPRKARHSPHRPRERHAENLKKTIVESRRPQDDGSVRGIRAPFPDEACNTTVNI